MLSVPFDENVALFARIDDAVPSSVGLPFDLILPATFQTQVRSSLPTWRGSRSRVGTGMVAVAPNLRQFCETELDVTALNRMHRHLWLTGLERPARPLHQQVAIGRAPVATENAGLHLLWSGDKLYVKPLPDFLGCTSMWRDVLCHDRELHERACGMLLSYLWLVEHRSDLALAHEAGLVPRCVDWSSWTRFAASVAAHLDLRGFNGINVRYRHGELRLSRINLIVRVCSGSRNATTFFMGYMSGYHSYPSFLASNLNLILSAIVYIGVVLTAMQVGLATERLGQNAAFQAASNGFTIFSILAPVGAVVLIILVTGVLIIFNLRYSLNQAIDWSGVNAMDYSHGHKCSEIKLAG